MEWLKTVHTAVFNTVFDYKAWTKPSACTVKIRFRSLICKIPGVHFNDDTSNRILHRYIYCFVVITILPMRRGKNCNNPFDRIWTGVEINFNWNQITMEEWALALDYIYDFNQHIYQQYFFHKGKLHITYAYSFFSYQDQNIQCILGHSWQLLAS